MSRHILRPAVALLALLSAVGGTRLWRRHEPARPQPHTIVATQPATPQSTPIDPVYLLSDGTSVSGVCVQYPTPAAAAETMQKKLRQYATDIIEDGPKLDAHGQRVGARVAAISQGKEGSCAFVLWTTGTKFCTVDAPRLWQALRYERGPMMANE